VSPVATTGFTTAAYRRRVLTAEDVHVRFGGVQALQGVSLQVERHEIVAVIGPNGAGKTTVINTISGVHRPHQGHVQFEGRDITGRRPARIAALGVARTFQNVALFPSLSVLDNLMIGRHHHMRAGVLACALYWGKAFNEDVRHRGIVEDVIDFLDIAGIRRSPVGALPYGLQKRVELGRALAAQPRLLLLDEPMAGMNVEEKEDMARFILDAHEEMGAAIVLIEHDMGVVMDISDRIVVLDHGSPISEGPPAAVREDPAVVAAYLGTSTARSGV
jgi:branched-chain amino acid transport system ATP-binding protein